MVNIRKLETELCEAADLLRADSKVTSQEYCMPVLILIFLRYAYSRFKFVEADIFKKRPVRNGRVLPVEPDDFKTKSAIFLPEEARYDYLLNAIATYRQQIYEYVYNTYPAEQRVNITAMRELKPTFLIFLKTYSERKFPRRSPSRI